MRACITRSPTKNQCSSNCKPYEAHGLRNDFVIPRYWWLHDSLLWVPNEGPGTLGQPWQLIITGLKECREPDQHLCSHPIQDINMHHIGRCIYSDRYNSIAAVPLPWTPCSWRSLLQQPFITGGMHTPQKSSYTRCSQHQWCYSAGYLHTPNTVRLAAHAKFRQHCWATIMHFAGEHFLCCPVQIGRYQPTVRVQVIDLCLL
jgi:hypothetical protein